MWQCGERASPEAWRELAQKKYAGTSYEYDVEMWRALCQVGKAGRKDGSPRESTKGREREKRSQRGECSHARPTRQDTRFPARCTLRVVCLTDPQQQCYCSLKLARGGRYSVASQLHTPCHGFAAATDNRFPRLLSCDTVGLLL